MARWTLLVLAVLAAPGAAAQDEAALRGLVTDAATGEPLLGATVVEEASGRGVATDALGGFRLDLRRGEVRLVVRHVGYEPHRDTLLLVADTTLHVALEPDESLGEVVVTAAADEEARPEETPQAGHVRISGREVEALPAFLGEADPLKAVHLLPGVRGGRDGTAGLHVRGGSPDQTLLLLDGVPLYNAAHLFGFVSTFNAATVESVDLTRGAYPARYGGRLGAVLDVTTRDGRRDRWGADARVGLLSGNLLVEGPLGPRASLLVAARRSYVDVLSRPFIERAKRDALAKGQTQVDPRVAFFDLNARLAWDLSSRDRLTLSLYGGGDDFDLESISPITACGASGCELTGRDDLYEGALDWGNRLTSLRYSRTFSPRARGTLSLAASDYAFDVDIRVEEARGSPEALLAAARYRSGIRDLIARADLDLAPSRDLSLRLGTSATAHRFTPGALTLSGVIGEIDTAIDTLLGDARTRGLDARAYAESRWRLGRLTLDLGLHAVTAVSNGHVYPSVEPRVSASWRVAERLAVKASAAVTQQSVHLLTSAAGIGLPADLWVPADSIGPQRGAQVALGLGGSSPSGRTTWTLDAHWREMRGLLAYREGASFSTPFDDWQDLVVTGQGRSRGVEAFVRHTAPGLTLWASYTLAASDRQFDALNEGAWFPYRYDRRHDLELASVVRATRRLDLSAVLVYGTGDAVTLPSATFDATFLGTGSITDWVRSSRAVEEVAYGPRNGFRLPPVARLDLGATWFFRRGERPHALSLHVYNATNRKNPFLTLLDAREDEATGETRQQLIGVSLFPILPSLSYRVAL